jgi:hypothetical protein
MVCCLEVEDFELMFVGLLPAMSMLQWKMLIEQWLSKQVFLPSFWMFAFFVSPLILSQSLETDFAKSKFVVRILIRLCKIKSYESKMLTRATTVKFELNHSKEEEKKGFKGSVSCSNTMANSFQSEDKLN